MVNDVISAVSNALYSEFGRNYRIYADNIEQNLVRPCFFINIIRPASLSGSIGRDKMSVPLVIQYFPSTLGKRTECYKVADRMFQCLKYPEFNSVVYRGTDLKYDINDDKLNFYVHYKFFTVTNDPDENINTIDSVESTVNTQREDED